MLLGTCEKNFILFHSHFGLNIKLGISIRVKKKSHRGNNTNGKLIIIILFNKFYIKKNKNFQICVY